MKIAHNHAVQHAACRDLAKGHKLMEAGRHYEATAALQRLQVDLRLRGLTNSVWEVNSLIWICRNKFHTGELEAALNCLHQIQALTLLDSPILYCEYYLTRGLINQRIAHTAFKKGNSSLAEEKAKEAQQDFLKVEETAYGNAMQLLSLNSRQNQINLSGLIAAINGTSAESNPDLIIAAMKIEAEIRQWTPPILMNNVTGLTIMADLSRPLNLELPNVYGLAAADRNFQGACLAIIGSPIKTANQAWPHALLEAARTMTTKPGQKARGLILGARMLIEGPNCHLEELGFAYQVNIADTILSLQKEVQSETKITRDLRGLSKAIDDRLGSQFKGRKVFR